MKNLNTRTLTQTALLTGLVLLLSFTRLGYIPFLTLSITIVHIPVILAVLTGGWRVGFFVAFLFGASSFYQSYVNPASVLSVLFQNPLISILPRLCIVPVMMLVKQCTAKLKSDKLRYGIVSASGSLTNTVLVLSAISIAIAVNPSVIGLDAAAGRVMIGTIWATSMVNAALECAAAVIIGTAVMTAYDKIYRKHKVQ